MRRTLVTTLAATMASPSGAVDFYCNVPGAANYIAYGARTACGAPTLRASHTLVGAGCRLVGCPEEALV